MRKLQTNAIQHLLRMNGQGTRRALLSGQARHIALMFLTPLIPIQRQCAVAFNCRLRNSILKRQTKEWLFSVDRGF
jgi:hypothetical protein